MNLSVLPSPPPSFARAEHPASIDDNYNDLTNGELNNLIKELYHHNICFPENLILVAEPVSDQLSFLGSQRDTGSGAGLISSKPPERRAEALRSINRRLKFRSLSL